MRLAEECRSILKGVRQVCGRRRSRGSQVDNKEPLDRDMNNEGTILSTSASVSQVG